jgi:hypothetical protein
MTTSNEITTNRTFLILILVAFLTLSSIALWYHGYWGIVEPLIQSFGAAQVLVDLTIALSMFLFWMWKDAKIAGRNPWPWIVATITTGSIGPLIYLILYKSGKNRF